MSRSFIKPLVVASLVLTGCAVPQRPGPGSVPPSQEEVIDTTRTLLVYIPQSDDAAADWLKWFALHPELRMVIAMSPRFARLAKDVALRDQFKALEKAGRLEIALQIPNAPILPLVLDPQYYGFSEDVVHVLAQSKAGFHKTWGFLPRGLMVPFGVSNGRLISLLERSGFTWVLASLGASPATGPVRVWDERLAKSKLIDTWIKEIKAAKQTCLLPRDVQGQDIPWGGQALEMRAWDGSDVSRWVGSPEKDAAWSALRRTREVLEKYKNSGRATVGRLDAAYNEIFTAQNSNYFSAAGNTTMSPATVEERRHEFQATLSTIFKLANEPIPEDLFEISDTSRAVPRASATTIELDSLGDGFERLVVRDAINDSLVAGGEDIASIEMQSSSESIRATLTLTTLPSNLRAEIYIDLNNQPNAGTSSFIGGRKEVAPVKDAWEYAIAFAGTEATLYRTQSGGTYGTVQTLPVGINGNSLAVLIPPNALRGRISRWGYQVLAGIGELSDVIDPLNMSQKELLEDPGSRQGIPFLRVRRN